MSITRGHTLKLFKPSATTRSRSDFLSSRAVDHWNKLPNYIVNASSIDNFKKLIDDYWTDLLFRNVLIRFLQAYAFLPVFHS